MILALVGLSFRVAQRTTESTDNALLMAALQARLDRALVIDYDSLGTLAGCATSAWNAATVSTCTTVTVTSPRTVDVGIKVVSTLPGSDTLSFTLERAEERMPLPTR